MKINLTPVRMDSPLEVVKSGDTLTINGEVFDFSVIPEGATLPATAVNSPFILGDIHRTDGELTLTLLLPNGVDASEAARFPAPIINPEDGVLELPV